ncbi:MAG: hypothetical protein JHC95_10255 [Solirubrobacteraceae bacterium]|nr:hypothetical protein [Solirubrobacteraceae bacterium]
MIQHVRLPLAALAVLALAIGGCSNESGDVTTSSSATKAVKFAECMRDNGVGAFPDPDASGDLTIDGVLNGSSIDPDGAAWKQAIAACKDLQPAGFTGPGKRSAEEQKATLTFAQCMRENGVRDFPDPANGEPLVDTRRIPSSNAPGGMTVLNAAMRKCGSAAGVGRR